MELSVSILGIKENIKENVLKLDNTNISYLHLDIMDGIFVENKTWETSQLYDIVKNCRTKLDVHLMVSDVYKYVTEFSKFNPEYITFHYEAVSDVRKIINYIKSFNIKVGLAIKPNTPLIKIKEFLGEIDLVLIMSVEPGQGGQDFFFNHNHTHESFFVADILFCNCKCIQTRQECFNNRNFAINSCLNNLLLTSSSEIFEICLQSLCHIKISICLFLQNFKFVFLFLFFCFFVINFAFTILFTTARILVTIALFFFFHLFSSFQPCQIFCQNFQR